MVLKSLLSLGFIINLTKSSLIPSQRILFLGVILDFLKMTVELPQEKLVSFRRRLAKVLRRASAGKDLNLLTLQSIVGTLISVNDCVSAVRIHINSLIELLRQALERDNGKVPHLGSLWRTFNGGRTI